IFYNMSRLFHHLAFLLCFSVLVVACDANDANGEPTPMPPSPTETASPGVVAATASPTLAPPIPTRAPAPPRGALVASVFRNGRWDLYALNLQGELQRRLTFGEGDNRAPAWSPDGARVAFESNREHNWDIYTMNTDGSDVRRLTTHARFDGSPRWSPDGRRIAFTSDRDGDLDIWVMDADGANALNLTQQFPAPDFDPAWSPDGAQIAFTSLRDGNKQIYVMSVDGANVRNASQNKTSDDEHPAWSPDGKQLAFVSERGGAREVWTLDVSAPQNRQRVTALAYHQWPVWSPNGDALLFVAQSETEQSLQWIQFGHGAVALTHDNLLYRQPDWNARATVTDGEVTLKGTDAPLYTEQVTPNPPNRPDRYNLVKLEGVRVIVPLLSDTVDDAFVAARQRVRDETGWDFMAALSEAVRPLTFKSNASDYLSWHKAGRAFDLLFDYFTPQGQLLEVAREDVLGATYWRLYFRTVKQDGSQGEPLRETIWDISETTRARIGGRGGLVKGVLPGYYVDLTELLRQYGWRRISSHTDPTFDWHRDFQALEYWHYQKTDDLLWWDAIHEIYSPQDIGALFSYPNLVKAKYDVLTMIDKGIPVPPEVLRKYTTLEP
ncbi:MAG: hypothetical protein ABI874_07625, partial [Chloroflexota bacterium]